MDQEPSLEKNKINLNYYGSTLVEVMVVMAVMAIVGTMLVVVFTNTLRGNNKAQILAVIKQNGQAVLENMDKTIRGADNVICPDPSASSAILVVVSNGIYTRYRFIFSPEPSSIKLDYPTKTIIEEVTETDEEFRHRVCDSNSVIPVDAKDLTDTNLQTGVSLLTDEASFRRDYFGSKDSISVSFTLKPAVNAPAIVAGQIDPVAFTTTVQLR